MKAKGEKDVTGADLEVPSQLELVNPDHHIASLTSKSSNWRWRSKLKKEPAILSKDARSTKIKLEIGVIPMDAMFTPVKKVGFKVQNMRVGDRTDFDKVIFEIETDGTITPETAFAQASEILVNHFAMLQKSFEA